MPAIPGIIIKEKVSVMDPNNLACIQKVKFIFDFFEKREWQPGEEPPLNSVIKSTVNPGDIKKLGEFLSWRMDRISQMMDILLSAHDKWAVTGKRDKVLMETDSWDFNDAVKLLKEHGFNDDEFILKVEYERKWGVL